MRAQLGLALIIVTAVATVSGRTSRRIGRSDLSLGKVTGPAAAVQHEALEDWFQQRVKRSPNAQGLYSRRYGIDDLFDRYQRGFLAANRMLGQVSRSGLQTGTDVLTA